MFCSWRSWLTRAFRQVQAGRPRTGRRPGSRPRLEPLEDRLALNTYTVRDLGDGGLLDLCVPTGLGTFNCSSLRAAVNALNTLPNIQPGTTIDVIDFGIRTGGLTGGVLIPAPTISLTSALPAIIKPVHLNGTTQPGLVRIDGSLAGALVDGPTFTGGGSIIEGLVITGFKGSGIVFDGGAKALGGNLLKGNNFIGTTPAGAAGLGNLDGVEIRGSSGNIIGGLVAVNAQGVTVSARNVISGNERYGINILDGSVTKGTKTFAVPSVANQVFGNLIGLAPNGTTALANGQDGILLDENTSRTVIGGSVQGGLTGRNIISGHFDNNGAGVRISGPLVGGPVQRNIVSGNYIGTDKAGTAAVGNNRGVSLGALARGNQVGAVRPVNAGSVLTEAANVISGNIRGVQIAGDQNLVLGNFIGTDASGTNGLVGSGVGVLIEGGANNRIGLLNNQGQVVEGGRNIISGNGQGVAILGSTAKNNQVAGNFIGSDKTGLKVVMNQGLPAIQSTGILVGQQATGTIIGARAPTNAAGVITRPVNLIAGHSAFNVALAGNSTKTQVLGNFIGPDLTGEAPLVIPTVGGVRTTFHGIQLVNTTNNTIGGTGTGFGNVISGHADNGVLISEAGTTGNVVAGNLIGTNKSGSEGLTDLTGTLVQQFGVRIRQGAADNTIGGTAAVQGGVIQRAVNVISGNKDAGIVIEDAATGENLVRGNFIGTDAGGTAPAFILPFLQDRVQAVGIKIQGAFDTTVGGPGNGQRNVISGNGAAGVFISGPSAFGNALEHNFIGPDKTGTRAVTDRAGNRIQLNGVEVTDGARSTFLGGPGANDSNVISGNRKNGVVIAGAAGAPPVGNFVLGNVIGTAKDGQAALGNGESGIVIDGATDNFVGPGQGASARGNTIAFNGAHGVVVRSGTGNTVSRNSIFANFSGEAAPGGKGLGIDLGDNGVTANDAGDPDAGANRLQNFPVLTSAVIDGKGRITVRGRLNTTPGDFTLEFFGNDVCDPSDHGEGKTFLEARNVTIAAGRNEVDFEFTFQPQAPADQLPFITATATAAATRDTSEFSRCRALEQQVYFNNFQGAVGPEWSIVRTATARADSSRRFLGEYSNDMVTLSLSSLPAHSRITISFDLYILGSWDGSATEDPDFGRLGPDVWELSVLGGPTLLRTTFSNHARDGGISPRSEWQDYPGEFVDGSPGGSHPAFTGASEVGTLGYTHPILTDVPMDSVYRLTFTFDHTADSVVFQFLASMLQDIGDESWGLDNVRVSVGG